MHIYREQQYQYQYTDEISLASPQTNPALEGIDRFIYRELHLDAQVPGPGREEFHEIREVEEPA